ncbi:MAG: hypothetical protein IJK18_06735 [Clostridia bacterium]|nr:hypothetical protein [Clostridia bacterium]
MTNNQITNNMTNNQIANMLLVVLGIMVTILIVLICIFIYIKIKANKKNKEITLDNVSNKKSKVQQLYSIQSIFNFMEFDRIEDNMIVQKKGKKFLMVVKCQGINYDLMSGVEKSSVEQGFIQYLNTLRNPIQIYVQTRTVDLTGSINTYKQKVRDLGDNLAHKEFEYNQKVRSGQYEKQELDRDKFEVVKARNLYEYGTDIVNNTERMSLNRNILTKQYYIILSHYPEEANGSIYGEDEINNIAFSELYTRAQSTISLLSVCGINSKILDSNELADLLYSAYNRDEAEVYDLNKAINAGYDSLYTTAQDVLEKRMKELDKQIEIDAIQKANDAVLEVRQERENERKLKEKEMNYDEMVERMAQLVLETNKDILGDDIVEDAKEKVSTKKTKTKSQTKEGSLNEQEKVKRAGRPRKSA